MATRTTAANSTLLKTLKAEFNAPIYKRCLAIANKEKDCGFMCGDSEINVISYISKFFNEDAWSRLRPSYLKLIDPDYLPQPTEPSRLRLILA